MKKIIFILMAATLALTAFLSLNIFKEYKTQQLFYKNTTSITLNFEEEKSYTKNYIEFLQSLAKKYNVNISKYIYPGENDLHIFTTDTSLNNHIKLKSGKFPEVNSNKFISTSEIESTDQIGIIKRIDSKTKITIQPLSADENFDGSGMYYISTQDKEKINAMLKELNENVAKTEIFGENKADFIYLLESNGFQIFCIFLIVLCIFVAIIHYIIRRLKDIAIMQTLGYTRKKIVSFFIFNLGKIMILSSLMIYVLFIMYCIFTDSTDFYFELSCIFWIIAITLSFILIIPITIITIVAFTRNINVSKIKGNKPYILVSTLNFTLKFLFIVVMLLSTYHWKILSNELNQKIDNLSNWSKTKHIYKTQVTFAKGDDLGAEEKISKKMKDLYLDMEKQHGGFLISTSNYDKIDGKYIYDLNNENGDPKLEPSGNSVTINSNYLSYNPIKSVKKTIKEQIIHDSNTMNILVPEKLKEYEKEIYKNYRKHFYFQKVEVDNIYNEELGREKNNTKEQELNINIIYVKNNQDYFTYDSTIKAEDKNLIRDPIAIIDTGIFNQSFYLSYVASEFYFKTNSEQPYDSIRATITKNEAQSTIQNITSVYDRLAFEIQNLKTEKENLLIAMIILIVSNFLITYNTISSYYEKNKFNLYIKQLFGFSAIKRNKIMITLLLLVNIIPIISVSIYIIDTYVISIGILILILEILISYFFDKKLSNQTFNAIIKGEH
ncbi:DUF1430 domain-containing protein [Bacillus cereus]|uniref:DUF1430 domain-containing protein n=2 Tax=Bacillus cereus TaxID=1396 RepID=UPI0001A01D7B|nr:DUF1430 domain-containing protein [Bacillus cereus]EEK90792.1 bacteriocin-associated integral membrane protein [Bacillus cereus m1550]MRB98566.1 DUF1430 domain-containing protein [Bacillus thuringiensis]